MSFQAERDEKPQEKQKPFSKTKTAHNSKTKSWYCFTKRKTKTKQWKEKGQLTSSSSSTSSLTTDAVGILPAARSHRRLQELSDLLDPPRQEQSLST